MAKERKRGKRELRWTGGKGKMDNDSASPREREEQRGWIGAGSRAREGRKGEREKW